LRAVVSAWGSPLIGGCVLLLLKRGGFFACDVKRKEITRQLRKSWLNAGDVSSCTLRMYRVCINKVAQYKPPYLCGHQLALPLQADSCTLHSRSNMNDDRRGGLGCMMIIILFLAASSTVLCKLHLTIDLLYICIFNCLCVYNTHPTG
jgi:hypothetical protein